MKSQKIVEQRQKESPNFSVDHFFGRCYLSVAYLTGRRTPRGNIVISGVYTPAQWSTDPYRSTIIEEGDEQESLDKLRAHRRKVVGISMLLGPELEGVPRRPDESEGFRNYRQRLSGKLGVPLAGVVILTNGDYKIYTE